MAFSPIAGLDFGTSNCVLALWRGQGPELIPLDNSRPHLASTLFAESADSNNGRTTLLDALNRGADVCFGEAAIARHLEDPGAGFFVKSPKAFLGAKLSPQQSTVFEKVLTLMLANLRALAERNAGMDLRQAVIGRPVNFQGANAGGSNAQALELLTKAARAAGFDEVSFLYEPVAAALDFERQLTHDQTVLVLDVGGGTTDCTVMRVGPSRAGKADRGGDILGASGERFGGLDFDISLAFRCLLDLFGRDEPLKSGLPMPSGLFWDAVTINDVNALQRFRSPAGQRELDGLLREARDPTRLRRLRVLQEEGLSYQLLHSAERAKIALSDADSTRVDLDYVEAGLERAISRGELADAIAQQLNRLGALMDEAVTQAQVAPDVLYVTGGTARSPVLEAFVRRRYADLPIVIGDLFGSIAAGLATWGQRG